jgi:hypothetical protein
MDIARTGVVKRTTLSTYKSVRFVRFAVEGDTEGYRRGRRGQSLCSPAHAREACSPSDATEKELNDERRRSLHANERDG